MSRNSYYKTILDERSAWFIKRERCRRVRSVFLFVLVTLLSSYLTVNAVGFGVGFSNMKTSLERIVNKEPSRCEPPYSQVLILLAPGFFAGCGAAEAVIRPYK